MQSTTVVWCLRSSPRSLIVSWAGAFAAVHEVDCIVGRCTCNLGSACGGYPAPKVDCAELVPALVYGEVWEMQPCKCAGWRSTCWAYQSWPYAAKLFRLVCCHGGLKMDGCTPIPMGVAVWFVCVSEAVGSVVQPLTLVLLLLLHTTSTCYLRCRAFAA